MGKAYVIAAVATGLLVSSGVRADVLCKKKSAVLTVRAACKGKETRVDPAAVGLVGPPGQKGDPGPVGPGALWALVGSDGTVIAQSGGITVAKPQTGVYLVTFGTSLAGKVAIASATCLDNDCPFGGTISAGICGGGAGGLTCAMSNTDSTVEVDVQDTTNTTLMDGPFFVSAF